MLGIQYQTYIYTAINLITVITGHHALMHVGWNWNIYTVYKKSLKFDFWGIGQQEKNARGQY